MISSGARRLGGVRRALWKLGTIPYNAAVLLGMAVVLLESAGWKIRARDARPVCR